MDLRHSVDITPWDHEGGSFFGLTRGQARWLGYAIIFIGLMLLSPPFDLIPNDWMNILLAGWIFNWLHYFTYNTWLVITYVILGPLLVLLGIWIFPYNSHSLINGYLNKAKFWLRKVFRNPIYIIIGVTLFILMYRWYKTYLGVGE